MKKSSAMHTIKRIAAINIVLNVLLAGGKLAAGIFGKSAALVSDAVHSASDVFAIMIVAVGMKLSEKEADCDHEYGHERIECIAALILASIVVMTGFSIGASGVKNLVSGAYLTAERPGAVALWAAFASIVVKEIMFRYTSAAAKRIESSALMADAWHSRADALSSVGSLLGVFAARCGFLAADPIAAIIIAVLIIKAGAEIFLDASRKLTDNSCGAELEGEMKELACSVDGVQRVDLIRTRCFGSKIYVDMEISADGTLSLYDAHAIAEHVHDEIERKFESVKHCTVHMNPSEN